MSSVAKPGLASLLIGLWLWLATFAGTSSFHQSLHADADTDGHHCVICLFAHGQVESPSVGGLTVLFIAFCVGLVSLARQLALTAIDLRLAPSRAPPHCSAPSVR